MSDFTAKLQSAGYHGFIEANAAHARPTGEIMTIGDRDWLVCEPLVCTDDGRTSAELDSVPGEVTHLLFSIRLETHIYVQIKTQARTQERWARGGWVKRCQVRFWDYSHDTGHTLGETSTADVREPGPGFPTA